MNRDFAELLAHFLRHDVRFLVIGGVALGAHGLQRATGDIDIWVRPEPHNAELVYAALGEFGLPLKDFDIEAADFARRGNVIQFGVPPRRVDVLTAVDGLLFEQAWPNRVRCDIAGHQVPVISLHDMLKNKEAAGRDQDRVDARTIRKELERRGEG